MDCAYCYIVKVDKIVENLVNFADYGSTKDTKLLKKCRKVNEVYYSKAREDAAFVWHAAGILADYYIADILRNNLGPPPQILDFTIEIRMKR